jgi:hypothetical protein
VSDFESRTLRRIDPDTLEVSTVLGVDSTEGLAAGPAELSLLSFPTGLSAQDDAHLLVAEFGSHVVRRVAVDDFGSAYVVGIAGLGGGLTDDPVPLADATLLEPDDAAAAGDDVVVLSDGAVWLARP